MWEKKPIRTTKGRAESSMVCIKQPETLEYKKRISESYGMRKSSV